MRALILAAGRGSRMGSTTAQKPKCLSEVAGRPLLHWQLASLRAARINDIALVRGYLAQTLQEPGCALFENRRWSETNMVATLACASAWIQTEPCIVSYADILYHADHIRALAEASGDIVVTYDRLWYELWSERFANPLDDAETFRLRSDGALAEIGRRAKSLTEVEGQYMGLFKLTPAGWTKIRALLDQIGPAETDRLDMTSLLSRLLSENIRIDVVPVEGRWCEVDSEADQRLYEAKISQKARWRHDWRFPMAA